MENLTWIGKKQAEKDFAAKLTVEKIEAGMEDGSIRYRKRGRGYQLCLEDLKSLMKEKWISRTKAIKHYKLTDEKIDTLVDLGEMKAKKTGRGTVLWLPDVMSLGVDPHNPDNWEPTNQQKPIKPKKANKKWAVWHDHQTGDTYIQWFVGSAKKHIAKHDRELYSCEGIFDKKNAAEQFAKNFICCK